MRATSPTCVLRCGATMSPRPSSRWPGSLAEKLVAEKAGRIDVPPELSLLVPTAIVTDYFGVTGAPASELIDWATLMFRYLFTGSQGDPELDSDALDAAAALPVRHRRGHRQAQGIRRDEGRRARTLPRHAGGRVARHGRSQASATISSGS